MKSLGIWGMGVVGQSVARYCLTHNIPIALLNDRPLTPEQQNFLTQHGLTCVQGKGAIEPFLATHDQIGSGDELRGGTRKHATVGGALFWLHQRHFNGHDAKWPSGRSQRSDGHGRLQ